MNWNKFSGYLRQYRKPGARPKGKIDKQYGELLQKLTEYQRRMRYRPTRAELRVKQELCRQLEINPKRPNKQILRQQKIFMFKLDHILKGYIADFYLPKLQAVIEVDGDTHDGRYANIADFQRSKLIRTRKLNIYRIHNRNTQNIEYLREWITALLLGKLQPTNESLPPKINLSRGEELRLQAEYIKKYGVKRLKPSTYKGHD